MLKRGRRAISLIREEGLTEFARRAYSFVYYNTRIPEELQYKLWERGVLDFDSLYGRNYYENLAQEDRTSEIIELADIIYDEYSPKNAIDLGCGPGIFIHRLHQHNVDVFGLDNSKAAFDVSPLPNHYFREYDLRQPFKPKSKYDLVICIEVLEHFSEEHTDTLIKSIVNSGDRIIASAAAPGQGGTIHMNEKPIEYWISKFENEGVSYCEDERDQILAQADLNSMDFLGDTLMIFD